MQELYDRHHKVSLSSDPHQNTNNSVKNKVTKIYDNEKQRYQKVVKFRVRTYKVDVHSDFDRLGQIAAISVWNEIKCI